MRWCTVVHSASYPVPSSLEKCPHSVLSCTPHINTVPVSILCPTRYSPHSARTLTYPVLPTQCPYSDLSCTPYSVSVLWPILDPLHSARTLTYPVLPTQCPYSDLSCTPYTVPVLCPILYSLHSARTLTYFVLPTPCPYSDLSCTPYTVPVLRPILYSLHSDRTLTYPVLPTQCPYTDLSCTPYTVPVLPTQCPYSDLSCTPYQRWAAILKNVSIKAIQIHNFWEKNWLKQYNFVGQNFFHRWSDRKNQTKIFSAPMKRYNIPRYKNFTDEATQLLFILENVSITAF